MNFKTAFDTTASALTANRLRMDVISSNIANATTTRGSYVDGQWVPYARKMVVMEPIQTTSFKDVLGAKLSNLNTKTGGGVKVTQIIKDESPFKKSYDPTHPDADADGFVNLPNVDMLKEMVDMISASRAYDANVTAWNATKSMYAKALEIGRS